MKDMSSEGTETEGERRRRHFWSYGPRYMRHRGYFPMFMPIEDEIKALERIKGVLEKRLEIVNKRLEQLKK
jgi:hypothetical protein